MNSTNQVNARSVATDLNILIGADETAVANLLLHEVQVPELFEALDITVRTRKNGPFEHHSIRVIDLLNFLIHDQGQLQLVCDGKQPVGNRYLVKLQEPLDGNS